MKKALTLTLTFLIFSAAALTAQNVNRIYNKYSGKKNVSSVYISPAMFKMIKTLPEVEINDRDIQLGNAITSFEGMYILDIEDRILGAELMKDAGTYIVSGKFELLMEGNDDDEKVRIYIRKEGNIVKEFVMITTETDRDPETAFISIIGHMTEEDMARLIAG